MQLTDSDSKGYGTILSSIHQIQIQNIQVTHSHHVSRFRFSTFRYTSLINSRFIFKRFIYLTLIISGFSFKRLSNTTLIKQKDSDHRIVYGTESFPLASTCMAIQILSTITYLLVNHLFLTFQYIRLSNCIRHFTTNSHLFTRNQYIKARYFPRLSSYTTHFSAFINLNVEEIYGMSVKIILYCICLSSVNFQMALLITVFCDFFYSVRF